MKCPYCVKSIEPEWSEGYINPKPTQAQELDLEIGINTVEVAWKWRAAHCPACGGGPIIELETFALDDPVPPLAVDLVFPQYPNRKLIGNNVPESFRKYYAEACDVIHASPMASAILARRILQAILKDQGYTEKDLYDQIESAMNEADANKALPVSLRSKIDAVRNIGNLGAHEIADTANQEILLVEPKEAEWCLDIIEELFDFYYGVPSMDERQLLANLNVKLGRAKKPRVRQ